MLGLLLALPLFAFGIWVFVISILFTLNGLKAIKLYIKNNSN